MSVRTGAVQTRRTTPGTGRCSARGSRWCSGTRTARRRTRTSWWTRVRLGPAAPFPRGVSPANALLLPRRRLVGPGDVFLQEAVRRPRHDRVPPLQHLGPPVLRQDPQEPRPRVLRLPGLPGRGAARTPLAPLTGRPAQAPAGLTPDPDPWTLDPSSNSGLGLQAPPELSHRLRGGPAPRSCSRGVILGSLRLVPASSDCVSQSVTTSVCKPISDDVGL